MDTIPERTQLAKMYRKVLDKYEGSLMLPFKNPSHYQVIGLVLSIVFLFSSNPLIKALLIIIVLVLDWLDGAAARKFGLTGKAGWMTDVAIDRMSEGLLLMSEIFNPLGRIFLSLFILNILLSFYSIRSGKHYSLPLRPFYLIILITRAI